MQIDHNFAIGVISGTIGSVLGAWVIYLLARAFKPLWTRMNAPAPLTFQAKIQLAQFLEYYQQQMQRLNHMAANPKDLYLYLFQLGITIFLLVSGALSTILFYSDHPTDGWIILGMLCLILALILSIVAIVEANKMSVRNIDKTKAKLQLSIDDARSKLGALAAAISPISPTASTSLSQSQSSEDKPSILPSRPAE
jgi:uncharacterized protein YacL